ncbi:MAG: hypothetical protein M5U14_21165 [Acidimicrobiia bacterium]|nr:hypothetical protein [Acidimicrobiia bacterium]
MNTAVTSTSPELGDDLAQHLEGEPDLTALDLGDRRLGLADQLGQLGLGDAQGLAELGEPVTALLFESAGLGGVDAAGACRVAAGLAAQLGEALGVRHQSRPSSVSSCRWVS